MRGIRARAAKGYDWLDERTGLRPALRRALHEPIRGGARWSYVFGSALLFLLALQALTGILLAMYYVPSVDHAHASVSYIQKAVPGGAWLRGLHHYGTHAMILLLAAHMGQTVIFGAYKGKRELLWAAGCALLLLTFGFAFTGSLLPWDQDAYFGAAVGAGVAGEVPVIGPFQRRVILGGTQLTQLTLSRFFMAHTLLLPLMTGLLTALHVCLFRRAGAAGPFHYKDDGRVERFYPKQLFKDSVCIFVVFMALAILSAMRPAPLGPQADPASDYLARPPWYFLPLFELLKYFPGKLSLIPAAVLPAALIAIMLLLPFLERSRERHPLKRPAATAAFLFVCAGAAGLVIVSKVHDRTDPVIHARLKRQAEEAGEFLKSPFEPQQVGGTPGVPVANGAEPLQVYLANGNPPPPAFIASCSMCHGDRGEGGLGPPLIGVTLKPRRSREDLLKLLDNSRAYGLEEPMPESFPDLSEEDKRGIADWLEKLKPD